MLSVLLIWIYMIPICFVWGFGFLKAFSQGEYRARHWETYILAGFGVLTVYSQVFSLIYRVSFAANVIMVIGTLLIILLYRQGFLEILSELRKDLRPGSVIVIILLGLVFAYGTSGGYIHYDTDLYHAQSIRWIEEYGVVRGLGNIHNRLAYNSAAFCLSALFSMRFLGGQSFHVCAGFLAYIISLLCRGLISGKEGIKPSLTNVARVVAIYYLVNIYDEMVSPASDYFVVLLVLGIVILFMECAEEDIKDPYPYGFLSLLSLVAMSVKISAALIVLIVIYPAYLLIKAKDIKKIVRFLLGGIASIVPFFVRNIILSGYLIYPVSGLDLFDFDYKIPLEVASYDAKEVQVYGRGHIDVERFDESISIWLPEWFKNLDKINKLSFLLAVTGIAVLLVIILINAYRLMTKSNKNAETIPVLLGMTVIGICFVGMIATSPNIRFGCVFLWLFPALVWGYVYLKIITNIDGGVLFRFLIGLFLVYKVFALGREIIPKLSTEHLVYQQDYGKYEVVPYDIGGLVVYYPKEGDQTGYYDFPSVPGMPDAEMIGDTIKDGFRSTLYSE